MLKKTLIFNTKNWICQKRQNHVKNKKIILAFLTNPKNGHTDVCRSRGVRGISRHLRTFGTVLDTSRIPSLSPSCSMIQKNQNGAVTMSKVPKRHEKTSEKLVVRKRQDSVKKKQIILAFPHYHIFGCVLMTLVTVYGFPLRTPAPSLEHNVCRDLYHDRRAIHKN